ncbi:Protein FMP42 [Fusarium oxysporum f. sp. cubense race 1]|uniref:Protein FMP42 n=1 Tax=Fusarium oxysporum f. sp. cubense (strain race 1) TaxID=1229664 RepID=N4UKG3_FUSC1|nr:Protein FMP42 [Fusarium oxysporum f. sp. cubense race 1]
MSLNRVQSIETLTAPPGHGASIERRGSDASLRVRRLTFNPVPQDFETASLRPDEQHAQTVGAFEVPQWKRLLQIGAAVVHCLFAAGIGKSLIKTLSSMIIFGYAAIKPVLKLEGAYSDVCKLSHYQSPTSDTNAISDDPQDTCVEIRLNLMFTVAAVGTNVAALPVGAILDHFGPRVCGLFGCLFLTIGTLLMAYAGSLPFDGLLPGYLFLALGGPFTYISSFQLSNAFPRHSGLILALLTGAFDSSSALFLVYRLIYNATEGSFTLRKFFLVYLIVPAVIFVSQIVVMPGQSYKTVGELVDQAAEADENIVVHSTSSTQHAASGVWGVLHDRTVLDQIRSPWFILICLFTVVQMTRINFFVATIRPQYEAIFGDHDRAVRINTFFDVALPAGGIFAIPFIGTALDHVSTVLVLSTLVACGTLIGILGVLPFEWAAYTGIVLFVLYRPFYYTAVSDYSAKVFGFRTFGTVYGLIICLSGLLNFSQSGLDVLFHETFNGNPVPVDIMLLVIGLVIGVALVVFVAAQLRKMHQKARAGIAQ